MRWSAAGPSPTRWSASRRRGRAVCWHGCSRVRTRCGRSAPRRRSTRTAPPSSRRTATASSRRPCASASRTWPTTTSPSPSSTRARPPRSWRVSRAPSTSMPAPDSCWRSSSSCGAGRTTPLAQRTGERCSGAPRRHGMVGRPSTRIGSPANGAGSSTRPPTISRRPERSCARSGERMRTMESTAPPRSRTSTSPSSAVSSAMRARHGRTRSLRGSSRPRPGNLPYAAAGAALAGALVAEHIGDYGTAGALAGRARDAAAELGDGPTLDRIAVVEARLALAQQRPRRAAEALLEVEAHVASSGFLHPGVHRFRGELVEALALAGRLEESGAQAAAFSAAVDGSPTPWGRTVAARSRGLVAAAARRARPRAR